jgi:molybdopterin-dependent oxidoreductase alpha subunit
MAFAIEGFATLKTGSFGLETATQRILIFISITVYPMAHDNCPRAAHGEREDKPAGGRGAVEATLRAFRSQGIPFQVLPALLRANKHQHFDCPGCAFPDKPGQPTVDSCEQGQKAIAWEMTRHSAGPDFFQQRSVEQLRRLSDHELEKQGRLTSPLLYQADSGRYIPIDWAQAFEIAALELRALPPDQVAFYASGRSSNEAAFLWQLVARACGCPNLPDSSNFCHESSSYALKASIGVGKGTCSLEDFDAAELIMVIGQNPASNHPRMMAALREATLRGTKVVAINPLRERGFTNFSDPKNFGEMISNTGIPVASRIYQVRIGGDHALFKGVMKRVLELDAEAISAGRPRVIDADFIATHTFGFEAIQEDLATESWAQLIEESGIARDAINELAELYADSRATMATWCMGLTHHEDSVATIQALLNLLLLKGNIGRPGAGAVPVRGHSNVQGDRTMGATSVVSPLWLDNLAKEFPQARFTRAAGVDANGVIDQLLDGRLGALLSLGGNFGVAAPDSPRVLAALSRCRFTLHIATKPNRTHCYPGQVGLLLPTLGRTDIDRRKGHTQVISVEDSMSNVRRSRGIQTPLSDGMMSEPAIVAGLGQALLGDTGIAWEAMADNYDRIRDSIERCQRGIVDDFCNFNRKLAEKGRFTLTNGASERRWNTSSGKANFVVRALPPSTFSRARERFGDDVLILMTVRSHDQFNTTVYGHDDRYRGVFGRRNVVFMNADDLRERCLQDGDLVDLQGCADDGETRLIRDFHVVRYDIPAGCAAAYFPEATALLPATSVSRCTQTPTYKAIPILVRAAQ